MPLVFEDIVKICSDEHDLRDFLLQNKIIGDFSGICPNCFQADLRLDPDRTFSSNGFCWRCPKNCRKKISIRKNSWFKKSHLKLGEILKLTYFLIYKYPQDLVKHELKIGSNHTLVDWYNFAREVCVEILLNRSEQIGGPGKHVEIDESKFGKRKYNRGKRVENAWVFGGIERESKICFFQVVEDRSSLTLIPIIKQHVKPGTTILFDCWKAYDCLEREGYTHLTVNHSIEFKNPETGACTNTIESTWNAVKNSA